MSEEKQYTTVLTKQGLAYETECLTTSSEFHITHIAVGDGNGLETTPNENQTSLINEVKRYPITGEEVNIEKGLYYATVKVPETDGGFTIRELGGYNAAGKLVMVSNFPPTVKHVQEPDDLHKVYIRMDLCKVNSKTFPSVIDPNLSIPSMDYLTEKLVNKADTDLSNLSETGQGILDGKANTSLSNLTPAGEGHFDNKYLNYAQITNCITKIPERIKYTLENGILTVKAGSVFIVPYGTEDLTAQYPIGATFVNDNFKVVDTQYSLDQYDNIYRFMVWAEMQNDISSTQWSTLTISSCIQIVSLSLNTTSPWPFTFCTPTAPTGQPFMLWYDTSNNRVKASLDGGNTWTSDEVVALPHAILDWNNGLISRVQVLNGAGIIGNAWWQDKGLELYENNSFNPDGSLKNIVGTTTFCLNHILSGNVTVYNQISTTWTGGIEISHYIESDIEPTGLTGWVVWYNTAKNLKYLKDFSDPASTWVVQPSVTPAGVSVLKNGVITQLKPPKVFQAADAQNLDGYWTSKYAYIAQFITIPAGYNQTFDLSGILPNDGNVYEIILSAIIRTGSNAGNALELVVSTDLCAGMLMCRAVTRVQGVNQIAANSNIVPVPPNRQIRFSVSEASSASFPNSCSFKISGYRKAR